MAGFIEKIHLKEKAEEDIYFAELDRKLINALHEKHNKASAEDRQHLGDSKSPDIAAGKKG